MPKPWTHEEIRAMMRKLDASLKRAEAEEPHARPLPPMTEEECREAMFGLLDVAAGRVLTHPERFLFGQLLSQYRQAVQASMLGRRGRYYVMSEEDIARLTKADT